MPGFVRRSTQLRKDSRKDSRLASTPEFARPTAAHAPHDRPATWAFQPETQERRCRILSAIIRSGAVLLQRIPRVQAQYRDAVPTPRQVMVNRHHMIPSFGDLKSTACCLSGTGGDPASTSHGGRRESTPHEGSGKQTRELSPTNPPNGTSGSLRRTHVSDRRSRQQARDTLSMFDPDGLDPRLYSLLAPALGNSASP